MKKNMIYALVASLTAFVGVSSQAVVISATDVGWYDNSGSHDPLNDNYIVGTIGATEFHDFFVFDLSGFGSIASATLRVLMPNGGYESPDATETWSLYDVSTAIATLTGGTGGIAAYDDLASGTGYGSIMLSDTDEGTYVEVTLNGDALASLSGAGGLWALGGALTTLGGGLDEFGHGFSGGTADAVELVVTEGTATVPEPATLLLFGMGLVGMGFARRSRA